jgi:DNA-binding transcriptional MerR regulator
VKGGRVFFTQSSVLFLLDSGIGSELYNARVKRDADEKGYVRAGELARAAGVSTDTLRHYERKGVLQKPRRSANGYREYPPDALARVLLVRRALAYGFTLGELAQVLRARERGAAPCREVRALAAAKLSDVEARLVELTALRDELRSTLTDWDSRLSKTTDGRRAGLLESLADSDSAERKRRAHAPAWRARRKERL